MSTRFLVATAALGAAFVLAPVAAGHAPAWSQDFSITNPEPPPATGSRRDLIRQLQAWWDVHAYYPLHASQHDEGGTVGFHLDILPDGRIGSFRVARSSGSPSLDAAALKTFNGGFIRPLPEGATAADLDLSLHYVLAHRHDQPVAANFQAAPETGAFTITNDPVKSPILETMLQKTCTGTIVIGGIRNHPAYGVRYYGSKLVFFRKPDGSPWVKFNEGPTLSISPVVQVGKLVSWTGPTSAQQKTPIMMNYTAWLDGGNKLNGCLSIDDTWHAGNGCESVAGTGTFEFSCTEEVVPQIVSNVWYETPASPPADPP